MRELPKSKYDENGRPIKKGISAIFNATQNLENNSNYEFEEDEVLDYKEKISTKYDKLEEDFKKKYPDNLNTDYKPNPLKPEDKEIFIYYIILLISFLVTFFGFIAGIIVLNKISNKKRTSDYYKYKPIRNLAYIVIAYSLIITGVFLSVNIFGIK